MTGPIIDKVAASGIIVLDLTKFRPVEPVVTFDISPFLFQGLMLRDKEFREQVRATDWAAFTGQYLALYCATDALVPYWAWLFVATHAQAYAKGVSHASREAYEQQLWVKGLHKLDTAALTGKKVVLQANVSVPAELYLQAGLRLLPVVQSLMCGEPGYAVPIHKVKPL